MAMRYIVRRVKPDDLLDIHREVSNLDQQLNKPGENYRRSIEVSYTNQRSAVFQFFTKKKDTSWIWVCPSVELVAENEEGLFALTDKLGIPRPSHLVT